MNTPHKEILKTLGIFVLGFIIIIVVAQTVSKLFVLPPDQPSTTTNDVVKCPADYDSFASTTKNLVLLENKPSNGNGNLKGYKITLKRTGLTDDIACGYLMYQISFGGKPIEQDYMALYMRPTSSQFGGHLWPDENRGAIIKIIDNKTQVIMPLDTITYDDTAKQPIKQANWASVLNVSDQIEFEIALSADVVNGNLDLVQFSYKCKNKDTGKDDGICSLEVAKTTPFGF